ncbi:Dde superfamily endonuclease [Plakobranchus ocellatus]|uniref:Dde superfamily endonuclease n=1 Tax=Plakobranchus ocellatus TaxID=259542 RepID=A0AAV3XY56_9GAST|nr:Dde superfamily endonuclease [Plakobranchus ocellatus]
MHEVQETEFIFIDEAGINIWTKRTRGRAVRGRRAVRVVQGRRGPNLTMTFAAVNLPLPQNFSVRYLPPYSPFLNICENAIALWKGNIKDSLAEVRDQLLREDHQQRMATLGQLAEQGTAVVTLHRMQAAFRAHSSFDFVYISNHNNVISDFQLLRCPGAPMTGLELLQMGPCRSQGEVAIDCDANVPTNHSD